MRQGTTRGTVLGTQEVLHRGISITVPALAQGHSPPLPGECGRLRTRQRAVFIGARGGGGGGATLGP